MADPHVDHVLILSGAFFRGRRRIGPDGIVIGRHRSCDIVLRSPSAPARAVRVERKADGYYAVALSPDVDLRVGGAKVLQAKLLDGKGLEVAGERIRYKRAARSRIVLLPLLGLLVALLAALAISYRFSDRYYRNLALREYEKGNTAVLEEYVDNAIATDAQNVLDDAEIMRAAEAIAPAVEPIQPVPEDTLERQVLAVLRGFGIRDPQIDAWGLSEIEKRIERYTTSRTHHAALQRALTRSSSVVPVVVPKLRASVLPEYLIFLSCAESHFVSAAKSPVGAAGIWQFMPATGREYGLYDRNNNAKATDAAIAYLTDLVAVFGADSILMAMASYNCGAGRVRGCLTRSVADPYSERSFWHISRTGCLPEETRDYVPKILAMAVMGTQPEKYAFTVPPDYQLDKLKPKFADVTIPPDRVPGGDSSPEAGSERWTATPSSDSPILSEAR